MIWNLLRSLIIGGLAGWIANLIMNKDSSNIVINIVLGLIGGLVGGVVLSLIGIGSYNFIGDILVSIIGACIAIWAYHKFVD